jgi:hypothetical protein
MKIKIDLYLSRLGLDLAPSEWIISGLLAGHRASSLAALFIKRLFNCDNIIAKIFQLGYKHLLAQQLLNYQVLSS